MPENRRPYVKVRRWEWRDADGTKTPGVGILRGQAVVAHLTPAEARTLADKLHDLADAAGNPAPILPATPAEQE